MSVFDGRTHGERIGLFLALLELGAPGPRSRAAGRPRRRDRRHALREERGPERADDFRRSHAPERSRRSWASLALVQAGQMPASASAWRKAESHTTGARAAT
jgi:hypothetical protein